MIMGAAMMMGGVLLGALWAQAYYERAAIKAGVARYEADQESGWATFNFITCAERNDGR